MEVVFQQHEQITLDTLGVKLFNKPGVSDSTKSYNNVQGHHKSVQAFFQGIMPVFGEEEGVCGRSVGPETKLPF